MSTKHHPIPILETMIGNRVDYSRSMLFYHAVDAKGNPKAKAEIKALANEILAQLTNTNEKE